MAESAFRRQIFNPMIRFHDEPALRDRAPVFADRRAAGLRLARMLEDYRGSGALVAAIPAGGVPVAVEISTGLGLELDVFPVSKILLPWNTESGFGAVAFDGSVWVNELEALKLGLSPNAIEQSTAQARSKVERRMSLLRGDRPLPELKGRIVMVVDDGVAAGSTMRVAVAALRNLKAHKVIVAVPTGHRSTVSALTALSDDIYCANVRSGVTFAVADAYERWHDLSEAELSSLLRDWMPGG